MSDYTIEKWLVVNKPRNSYSSKSIVKLATKEPSLKANQVAVKVTFTIPEEVFATASYNTQLTITKDMLPKKTIKSNITKLINI